MEALINLDYLVRVEGQVDVLLRSAEHLNRRVLRFPLLAEEVLVVIIVGFGAASGVFIVIAVGVEKGVGVGALVLVLDVGCWLLLGRRLFLRRRSVLCTPGGIEQLIEEIYHLGLWLWLGFGLRSSLLQMLLLS